MYILSFYKKIFTVSSFAIIIGLIFSSFPVVPMLASETTYNTKAFDAVLKSEADFAGGRFDNVQMISTGGGHASLRPANGRGGVYITPVTEAPFDAGHIGLHWEEDLPEGADVVTYIRTSDDGENFSEWVRTTVEDGIGPDGFESEETFAALVGVGNSSFAQAKVEFIPGKRMAPTVRSLTFTFLNSSADSKETVKKLTLSSWATAAETIKEIFEKTSVNYQSINVISREGWGANEEHRMEEGEESWPRSYTGTRKVAVHHTADAGSNGETDLKTNMETVRNIYYYHAVTRGWGDIGYNALVDADGNIYEGRYGTHDEKERSDLTANDIMVLDVDAGHVSGHNSGSFGVSALGDFTDYEVPENQLQAVKDVIAYVADERGIYPEGSSDFSLYNDSWHYDLANVYSHRDAGSTACPGDYLYAKMDEIKSEVASGTVLGISGFLAKADQIALGDVSGDNIGSSSVSVSWGAFDDASEYEYVLEHAYGVVDVASTSQPWESAWFHPENENVATTSDSNINFAADSFDNGEEYIVYVRALNSDGAPISGVAHVNFHKDENNVIVDNRASDYTQETGESWTHSQNVSGYYGTNYQANEAGDGSETFEWSPNIFQDGYYDVFVMYTSASDRWHQTPYTVFYQDENGDGLSDTVEVNQKSDGGKWVLLGNYYFSEADGPRVKLSDDIRRGHVIADAVKLSLTKTGEPVENKAPVADAGGDQTVEVDTEVNFDGSGSTDDGGIQSYEWDFGDSATGTGVSPEHTYSETGKYTVTLTVTDDEGLTGDDTMTVTVIESVEESIMSVEDIDMALQSRGLFTLANATVTVFNSNNEPVEGATVYGTWSGLTKGTDSGTTGTDGQITFESDRVREADGKFIFTIESVTKSGWTCETNCEDSASISTSE